MTHFSLRSNGRSRRRSSTTGSAGILSVTVSGYQRSFTDSDLCSGRGQRGIATDSDHSDAAANYSTRDAASSGSGPLAAGDLYLEGGSDGAAGTGAGQSGFPGRAGCAGHGRRNRDPLLSGCGRTAAAAAGYAVQSRRLAADPCNGPAATPHATSLHTATPQISPWSMSAIQQAMLAQCTQLQYRVAVLDTPMSLQPSQALSLAERLRDIRARRRDLRPLYYPWLQVPDELESHGPNRTVPPCGHVAGAYAYTDNQFGVQKPPANVELQFISDVELAVTNQQQGFLNPAGINAIRAFPGPRHPGVGRAVSGSPSQDPPGFTSTSAG